MVNTSPIVMCIITIGDVLTREAGTPHFSLDRHCLRKRRFGDAKALSQVKMGGHHNRRTGINLTKDAY